VSSSGSRPVRIRSSSAGHSREEAIPVAPWAPDGDPVGGAGELAWASLRRYVLAANGLEVAVSSPQTRSGLGPGTKKRAGALNGPSDGSGQPRSSSRSVSAAQGSDVQ
jgi:hypothetical protein